MLCNIQKRAVSGVSVVHFDRSFTRMLYDLNRKQSQYVLVDSRIVPLDRKSAINIINTHQLFNKMPFEAEKIPPELLELVESFKNHIRRQKAYKDQKFEVDPIIEVGRDIDEFALVFQRVAVDCDKIRKLIEQIKAETTKLLRHSESAYGLLRLQMAKQQQEPQQQHPNQYFSELADQFEARMKSYGVQIKELKMSLDSRARTYSVDELFKWLKKQHETLAEIAAKIYMTHERIMEKYSQAQPTR